LTLFLLEVSLTSNGQLGIHQGATGGLKVNVIEAWPTLCECKHWKTSTFQ
jgi:hypothetical protein